MAPSPTGAIHLGNARTFLVNWAMARQGGWAIRFRVEDLDGPRVKPGAATAMIEILRWLGLDWDGEAMVQSEDLEAYREAMRQLARAGRVYPCELTRSEIESAASAPHEEGGERPFPRHLRPGAGARSFEDERTNWRFVVPEGAVEFVDEFAGRQSRDLSTSCGDFVVWTKRGVPAYQLAVVVDDARQGVNEVVRGDDLLESAARQIALIEALGSGPAPRYAHVPLVVGPDGRRLAKRHGDTRLAFYRDEAGTTAERVIGLLAKWCGVSGSREPMSATGFLDRFRLTNLPRGPVVMTEEDDRWLRGSFARC